MPGPRRPASWLRPDPRPRWRDASLGCRPRRPWVEEREDRRIAQHECPQPFRIPHGEEQRGMTYPRRGQNRAPVRRSAQRDCPRGDGRCSRTRARRTDSGGGSAGCRRSSGSSDRTRPTVLPTSGSHRACRARAPAARPVPARRPPALSLALPHCPCRASLLMPARRRASALCHPRILRSEPSQLRRCLCHRSYQLPALQVGSTTREEAGTSRMPYLRCQT
jgi:hypothetical protein